MKCREVKREERGATGRNEKGGEKKNIRTSMNAT